MTSIRTSPLVTTPLELPFITPIPKAQPLVGRPEQHVLPPPFVLTYAPLNFVTRQKQRTRPQLSQLTVEKVTSKSPRPQSRRTRGDLLTSLPTYLPPLGSTTLPRIPSALKSRSTRRPAPMPRGPKTASFRALLKTRALLDSPYDVSLQNRKFPILLVLPQAAIPLAPLLTPPSLHTASI